MKLHQERLAEIGKAKRGATQKALISTLNPIIRGWCGYYRSVCSTDAFNKVDTVLQQLLMRWAKWRHRHKGMHWIVRRYWQMPGWTFGPKDGKTLRTHIMTKIVRHVKVKGTKSPFDGDWTYWASRQTYYPGVSLWMARVLKRQRGKCVHCGLMFMPDDLLEVHHVKVDGKRTGQLDVLHRHCHDKVHGPGSAVDPAGGVHDKD